MEEKELAINLPTLGCMWKEQFWAKNLHAMWKKPPNISGVGAGELCREGNEGTMLPGGAETAMASGAWGAEASATPMAEWKCAFLGIFTSFCKGGEEKKWGGNGGRSGFTRSAFAACLEGIRTSGGAPPPRSWDG